MFKRIQPKRISDEIVSHFEELISNGQLKPGDKLPSTRNLAQMMGVSMTPLRDALNTMRTMGLIEMRPRSRSIVISAAKKSLEDPLGAIIAGDINKVFELLEIRKGLERWSAYKAASRATDAEIKKLGEIVEEERESISRMNEDDSKADADFHMAIATASHNTLFMHLSSSCYNLMEQPKIFKEKHL